MLDSLLLEAAKGALTGGIVGYATNALAVWMLFHPRAPLSVFGIRVPLTPGLVEKNRDGLADSIGRTVAGDLLDSDTLAAHLRGLDLCTPMAGLLRSELAKLATESRSLIVVAGPDHGAALLAARDRVARELAAYAPRAAEETVPAVAQRLSAPPASFTLSAIARDALAPRLASLAPAVQEGLAAYLGSEEFGTDARERLSNKLRELIIAKYSMAKMFIGERTIHDMLEARWEEIAAELRELALSPGLTVALGERISASAETLADALPGILSEGPAASRISRALSQWLATAEGADAVSAAASAGIDRMVLDRPVRDLVALLPSDEWERAIAAVAALLDDRAHRLLPQLLREQLDLAAVVTAKIREFDAARIEETIKRVSGRELRGIVRLGGLIGVIVGAVMQVAFHLMRG